MLCEEIILSLSVKLLDMQEKSDLRLNSHAEIFFILENVEHLQELYKSDLLFTVHRLTF